MMPINSRGVRATACSVSILYLSFGLLLSPMLAAREFTAPDLSGFTLRYEREVDGDGDGSRETRIQQYFNARGDSIFSMSAGSRVWAWSLDTHADDSAVRNYLIRDSDCDGVFDEVYGLDQAYDIPACVLTEQH